MGQNCQNFIINRSPGCKYIKTSVLPCHRANIPRSPRLCWDKVDEIWAFLCIYHSFALVSRCFPLPNASVLVSKSRDPISSIGFVLGLRWILQMRLSIFNLGVGFASTQVAQLMQAKCNLASQMQSFSGIVLVYTRHVSFTCKTWFG